MPLTQAHRRSFTLAMALLLSVLTLLRAWYGGWLVQTDPFVFHTRFDGLTWQLMRGGWHQWLMHKPGMQLAADLALLFMPWIFLAVSERPGITSRVVALVWLFVNWIYVQLYTLYPTQSIEGFTAWLLLPFLFMTVRLKSFYLMLQGLRYFFLFQFVSAGVWKIVQGGVFEPLQMSAILMEQHKDWMIAAQGHWQERLIAWLIDRPTFSYMLYLAATLLELSFIIGFFTRRYDKLLIVAFLGFLVFDWLIMRIPYEGWLPYLLVLWYGRYAMPAEEGRFAADQRFQPAG